MEKEGLISLPFWSGLKEKMGFTKRSKQQQGEKKIYSERKKQKT